VAGQSFVDNQKDKAVDLKGWLSLSSAALTAVVVGFASTILLIMEAARAVGANPAEQASWAMSVCIGMAVTTLILSWRYRMPIITAWSTPGAALIATSTGITYVNALGAFVVAGALMCLAALIAPLAKAIEKIPGSVASAMLAGVLLVYCLRVPAAGLEIPVIVLPLAIMFFALRLISPLFAVPVVVVAGLLAVKPAAISASPNLFGRRPSSTFPPLSAWAFLYFSSPWPRKTYQASPCSRLPVISRPWFLPFG
jgi:predicted benzoate:H+ symporter BenE